MLISYDPAKRQKTLEERGLDFDDAGEMFEGLHYTSEDTRKDYGETRYITAGYIGERMMVIVWTRRGNRHHIISMRKANAKEKKYFKTQMD